MERGIKVLVAVHDLKGAYKERSSGGNVEPEKHVRKEFYPTFIEF